MYIKVNNAEIMLATIFFAQGKALGYEVSNLQEFKDVAKEWFRDIPREDVVEVVRCEDCIHNVNNICDSVDIYTDDKFYCAFGERATEDD